jgi:zinc transporter ZupT
MADESDFQLQNSLQAIEYGKEAVRTGVLVNGGAAVALLSFVGSGTRTIDASDIKASIQIFCFGVIFAFIAAAMGYIAQTEFALHNRRNVAKEKSTDEKAKAITGAGLLAILVSLVCFLYGINLAGEAIFPT